MRIEQPEVPGVRADLINKSDYFVKRKRKYKSITESRCLRVEPRWMYDNQELIGDLRLKDILLTGTHDAAAFK